MKPTVGFKMGPRPAGQPGGPEFRPTFFCVFFHLWGAFPLCCRPCPGFRRASSRVPCPLPSGFSPHTLPRFAFSATLSLQRSLCLPFTALAFSARVSASLPVSRSARIPAAHPAPAPPLAPRPASPNPPSPEQFQGPPPLLRAVIRVGSRRPDTEGTSPSIAILAQAGGPIVAARCHWMHASTKSFRTSLLSSCTTMARTMSQGLVA